MKCFKFTTLLLISCLYYGVIRHVYVIFAYFSGYFATVTCNCCRRTTYNGIETIHAHDVSVEDLRALNDPLSTGNMT